MNVSATERRGGVKPDRGGALVIGYGSALHGDDGAGPAVAERIDAEALPGVRVLTPLHLTPELAQDLAACARAIFIDAAPAAEPADVRVTPLEPRAGGSLFSAVGHLGDPGALLDLAEGLYGARPDAWFVTVPAHAMDLGEGLSEATARHVEAAVRAVRRLLEGAADA